MKPLRRLFLPLAAAACMWLLVAVALSGCGYAVRFAAPPRWWNDGATAGPDRIDSQPLLERNAGR